MASRHLPLCFSKLVMHVHEFTISRLDYLINDSYIGCYLKPKKKDKNQKTIPSPAQ